MIPSTDLQEVEEKLVISKMQKFEKIIENLRQKKGSFTTTDVVKADSRRKEILEWDDRIAGNLWRHHEVRIMLHNIPVSINDKIRKAYYNIITGTDRAYHFLPDILKNPDLLETVTEDYKQRLFNLNEQYGFLIESQRILTYAKKVFAEEKAKRGKVKGQKVA